MDAVDRLQLLVIEPGVGWARRLVAHLSAGTEWQIDAVGGLEGAREMVTRKPYDGVVLGPAFEGDGANLVRVRRALPDLPIIPLAGSSLRDLRSHEAFDNLAQPVLCFDLAGAGRIDEPVLVQANRALGDFLGGSTDDYLADPGLFWAAIHNDDRGVLQGWFTRPSIQHERLAIRFADEGGAFRRTELVLAARRDSSDDVVFADVLIEVPGRVAMVDDALLEGIDGGTLDDAVAEFHLHLWPRLGVIWANDACGEVFGLDQDLFLSKPATLFDAIEKVDMAKLEQAMQVAAAGEAEVTFSMSRGREAGRSITMTMTALPAEPGDGVVLRCAAMSADAAGVQLWVAGDDEEVPSPEPTPTPSVVRQDVGELVAGVVGNSDIGDRMLTLDAECVELDTETQVITRAVAGMLENVRLHTPSGTHVQVTVARAMTGVLVTVRDDGPGIPWPPGHNPGSHGLIDAADLVESGGAGIEQLVHAAKRHRGRATIQVVPDRGTTIRLLIHNAIIDSVPAVSVEPADTASGIW